MVPLESNCLCYFLVLLGMCVCVCGCAGCGKKHVDFILCLGTM